MTTASEQTTEAVAERISGFLEQRTKLTWEPDTDLFDSGAVSSLFATELVVFLEETFDIEIVGRDLRLDNFRTVRVMTDLVRRLREENHDG
ncbi:acyl carrier protein [Saccharomonospora xinjiangensis]|uniref:Acyl carrier protein n=1 Tax=Saccharomonospora xinjiangensis XJ-54 TaxID=882086 RepID=I0V8Y7_9PSEU|nr:acyl carrier protein [Saccharomonospora xinjiangensis]EID56590.1 acyl carrier protein [Saccharomonospora xinjiangensis XJ-54]